MESLPFELVSLIAEHCDHSDLRNLRLVNQRLHEAATSHVFEDVHMAVFDHSLDKFVSIAKSRHAKHVVRITFYLDLLPEFNRRQWERSIGNGGRLRPHKGIIRKFRREFSADQLDRAWSEFGVERDRQLQWHESKQGLVFKEHLAMLPNVRALSCIEATIGAPRSDTSPCISLCPLPVWDRLVERILVHPIDWVDFPAQLNPRLEHDAMLRNRISFSILEAVAFRASFSGTSPITSLKLNTDQRQPWSSMLQPDFNSASLGISTLDFQRRYNAITDCFRSLTEVHWWIHYSPVETSGTRLKVNESVRLLHAAERLQTLTLVFRPYSYNEQAASRAIQPPDSALASFMDTKPPWPHLTQLRLSIFDDHSKLPGFLEHLGSSLRELELMDMKVKDVTQLISCIPQKLALQHVRIGRIWQYNPVRKRGVCYFPETTDADHPLERLARAYLLRETTEIPNTFPEYPEEGDLEMMEDFLPRISKHYLFDDSFAVCHRR